MNTWQPGNPGDSIHHEIVISGFGGQGVLIFFEDSGHGMIWEQADLFHRLMVETILRETYK